MRVPRFSDELRYTKSFAAESLVRAHRQVRAIEILIDADRADSALVNVRALCEVAGELHKVLTASDPEISACAAVAFALAEASAALRDGAPDADDNANLDLAGEIERALESLEADNALALATARQRVEKGRNVWYAGGAKQLIAVMFTAASKRVTMDGEMPNSEGAALYKLLSWETHNINSSLAVAKHIDTPLRFPESDFAREQSEDIELTCYYVALAFGYAYTLYGDFVRKHEIPA